MYCSFFSSCTPFFRATNKPSYPKFVAKLPEQLVFTTLTEGGSQVGAPLPIGTESLTENLRRIASPLHAKAQNVMAWSDFEALVRTVRGILLLNA